MNVWKRISSSHEHHQCMKRYYDDKGLADLREYMAEWLEERIMTDRFSGSELFEPVASKFYEDLTQRIVTLSSDNHIKYKLEEICKHITQITPVELYAYIRNGLQTELQLLKEMPQNPYAAAFAGPNAAAAAMGIVAGGNGIINGGGMEVNGAFGGVGGPGIVGGGMDGMIGMAGMNGVVGGPMPHGIIGGGGLLGAGHCVGGASMMQTEELMTSKGRLHSLMSELERIYPGIIQLGNEFERLTECYSRYNQTMANMTPDDREANGRSLQTTVSMLMQRKKEIIVELRNIVRENDSVQNCVVCVLNNWRRNQALAGNGAQYRDNLDEIQSCIELLVDIAARILMCGEALEKVIQNEDDELKRLLAHVKGSRAELVCSAFIVDRQPPQVMKTNTRFAAAVRWLIGPQLGIGSERNTPQVECIILSEAQAQRHFARRSHMEEPGSSSAPQSSGDLSNNTSNMEYQQNTRVFSASFRNMQLKKIKRAEKKGTESVMDEKFALLFLTTVNVSDYRIRVWTLSLPVVVIVHGNQEPQSWATITWDNAFAEILREPFQVPDKVSWSQLSVALNTKFTSTTGRSLTEENLCFLYEKLFHHDFVPDDQKDYITWAQFCKEPLPDRSFTFWEWFFAIMKLTKDHLLNLWKAGLIVGFIGKQRTIEQTLCNMPPGTFILRFSDSESGGITVAFVNTANQVLMLTPWTARDLGVLSLADRIRDLSCLSYLYPSNMNKDEAFGEFYTNRIEEAPSSTGYVRSVITTTIPGIGVPSATNTPHHQMQSPNTLGSQMYDDDGIEMYLGTTNVHDFMMIDPRETNVEDIHA